VAGSRTIQRPQDPGFDLGKCVFVRTEGRDRSGLGAEHLSAEQRDRSVGAGRLATDEIHDTIDERRGRLPPQGSLSPVADDPDEFVLGVGFEGKRLTARESVGGGALPRSYRLRNAAQDEPAAG
jgi:hypothetical protein